MNPLQRASRNRKIIYFVAIVALFTVSLVWRGVIPVPLGTTQARAAQPFRWAADHTIQSQAQRLEVWEADPNESEAEVSSSVMQLALTGSRGVVVTGLWLSAIEKQKRNDFHEFEQRVQMVTKLQPNFIAPWIFQSWNISYNVSVEMQGSGDMYYYIVRGIQLLAEGERRNKRSPDMRYWIAFYYQNKFGVSDNAETLRCMFDLSCIPPKERDPNGFYTSKKGEEQIRVINEDVFRAFCAQHPHLVRRLRGENIQNRTAREKEQLVNATPEEIVDFLRNNYDVPSRYKENSADLREPQDREAFPVLPPKFETGNAEFVEADPSAALDTDSVPTFGYFSPFKAARAWYSYSLLLLPPPMTDDEGRPIPGPTPPPGVGGHDPSKHRVPRSPTLIVFRQGAPRAQSYHAEMEQKEGWFLNEGWRIDAGTQPELWWFPDHPEPAKRVNPQDVVVGREREWSLREWDRAKRMWADHGKTYAMSLDEQQLGRLEQLAQGAGSTADRTAEENLRRRQTAAIALQYYWSNRSTTNFPFFLNSASAEARLDTVTARRTLWQAEQARKIAKTDLAKRLYKQGLEEWMAVLVAVPNFHRLPPPDRSDRIEEETYEYELAYQRLLIDSEDKRVLAWANQMAHANGAVVPFLVGPYPNVTAQWPEKNRTELKWWIVENVAGADFSSPFVGTKTAAGEPWVYEHNKDLVRGRHNIARSKPAPVPATQPGAAGPGGPGSPQDPKQ